MSYSPTLQGPVSSYKSIQPSLNRGPGSKVVPSGQETCWLIQEVVNRPPPPHPWGPFLVTSVCCCFCIASDFICLPRGCLKCESYVNRKARLWVPTDVEGAQEQPSSFLLMLGTVVSLFWREGRGPLSVRRKPIQWKGEGHWDDSSEGPPLPPYPFRSTYSKDAAATPRSAGG